MGAALFVLVAGAPRAGVVVPVSGVMVRGDVIGVCTVPVEPSFVAPGEMESVAGAPEALGHGPDRSRMPVCTPPERRPPTTGRGEATSQTTLALAAAGDAMKMLLISKMIALPAARFIRHTVPASP